MLNLKNIAATAALVVGVGIGSDQADATGCKYGCPPPPGDNTQTVNNTNNNNNSNTNTNTNNNTNQNSNTNTNTATGGQGGAGGQGGIGIGGSATGGSSSASSDNYVSVENQAAAFAPTMVAQGNGNCSSGIAVSFGVLEAASGVAFTYPQKFCLGVDAAGDMIRSGYMGGDRGTVAVGLNSLGLAFPNTIGRSLDEIHPRLFKSCAPQVMTRSAVGLTRDFTCAQVVAEVHKPRRVRPATHRQPTELQACEAAKADLEERLFKVTQQLGMCMSVK